MTLLDPVQVDALPQTVEEFISLQQQLARTPQGGAAMVVAALLVYAEDEALGWSCLSLAAHPDRLGEGPHDHAGRQLRTGDRQLLEQQMARQPYMPRSYVQGSSSENGYEAAPPYQFAFSANRYSGDPAEGQTKLFVACSGASTPRPVTVRRDESGLWRALESSSLIVGVVKVDG
ncbi:MAG: hypothetical protein JXA37_08175 [Chloroflexia bacterium]|nr:hypothetical protein [Chloroflexia bacterium]